MGNRFLRLPEFAPEGQRGHIDILTANFALHPDWFDVVVASNLFGDILSDLGPACTGTIGIAPSANINPERQFPSRSNPSMDPPRTLQARGVANPIEQIWCVSMMLEHLGNTRPPPPSSRLSKPFSPKDGAP